METATPSAASSKFLLQPGGVYRRKDLLVQSHAVDRDLQLALRSGALCRVAQGLYYAPIKSVIGDVPPSDQALISKFLEDRYFLLLNPSYYNGLGLGTTQLYNQTLVYNHKRHGIIKIGGRTFDFRIKHRFPETLTTEFLWVDCLNNVNELAEDPDLVIDAARRSLGRFDISVLRQAVLDYGSAVTRRLVQGWFDA